MQRESTPRSTGNQDAFRLGPRAEQIVVWVACFIAALRVFVFSAAFPFFNNVDEQYHFDLVLRYARGGGSPSLLPVSAEAAEYIAVYESPEYYTSPENYADRKMTPPIWMLSHDGAIARFKGFESIWGSRVNHEGTTPPLYYWSAALWWRMGELFGMEGGYLLYWVRFLNVFVGAALVWLGYWAARLVYPGPWFPRLAVAVLLAFYPQDIFYSIQSDVLSPLLFGLAFIGLIKMWGDETRSVGWAAFTGLSLAAATLVKATNLPLLAVAALAMLVRMCPLDQAGKGRIDAPIFGMLFFCALLPVGGWMLWNSRHLGDLTGTAQKIQLMRWSPKPLNQWWPHPLFTVRGLKQFLGELLASFWRGEFAWHGHTLKSPFADAFYALSSLVFIAASFAALLQRDSNLPALQRPVLWMALGSFASVVALQAVSSMAFDFGTCEYPSRARPFFTSGRLMTGALTPFLLLYVRGLDKLLGWRGHHWIPLAGLAAIVLVITVSEIEINRPAFSSLYNFFHLVPLRKAVADVPAVYLYSNQP
jgi:hypothetical protein